MNLKRLQKLNEEMRKLLNESEDMIQCVIKVQDIGNALSYEGIVEDNTNHMSQYDVDVEFQDILDEEDPTIQFILAYHIDGTEEFYDENGDLIDLDMTKNNEFQQALDKVNNSLNNTVIPNIDML